MTYEKNCVKVLSPAKKIVYDNECLNEGSMSGVGDHPNHYKN
jgi:hypothetical protein